MQSVISRPSRRSFLIGASCTLGAPMLLRASRAGAESASVTIVNYGGAYQDASVKAIYEPFTKETGIKVRIVPYPGLDKIKAMQLTGNVDIDVYACTGAEAAAGSKRGFWEKLNASLFDIEDLKIKPASDYVTFEIACKGISWDPKKFPSGKHPTAFAELFDLEKFPGRRALRAIVQQTLEIALLADGVAPKHIYPLDLNRAFKVLDRVRSQIVWAATTPQDTSLLQIGEADFGYASSNRVKSTTEPGGGVPLAFSFEQNITLNDAVTVLKGAPNKENAVKLISYHLRPEVQARFFEIVGTTPVSKKAFSMLSAEVRKWQPDLDSPKNLHLNDTYWAENYEALHHRFQEWRLT
ncbi:ABC transporter substrate-binding protein [Bradyrhizobium sp. RDM12]